MIEIIQLSKSDSTESIETLYYEYLSWVETMAREEYGIKLHVKEMIASDKNQETRFYPPAGRFVVAKLEGEVAGFGCLKKFSCEIAEIKRMFVLPKFRGNKIGGLILDRLLHEARIEHYRFVNLDTMKYMKAAQSLYYSRDFKDIEPYGSDETPDKFNPYYKFMQLELNGRTPYQAYSGESRGLTMKENEVYSGRCGCGAIRYHVYGPPVMVEYCHCGSCRKSYGSVVSVLAGFRRDGFQIDDGVPTYYDSSSDVKRSFCGTCGTPLFYENQSYPDDVYISLGSFDDPGKLPPDRHVWASERISWYQIRDELPCHGQFSSAGTAED